MSFFNTAFSYSSYECIIFQFVPSYECIISKPLKMILKSNKTCKKFEYNEREREIENGSFSPLILFSNFHFLRHIGKGQGPLALGF